VRAARSRRARFSVGALSDMEPIVKSYKGNIANAEPVGAFVNDNIMVTSAAFVKEDGNAAVKSAVDAKLNYLQSTCSATTTRSRTPSRCPTGELIPTTTPTRSAVWRASGRSSVATRARRSNSARLGIVGRRPTRVRCRLRGEEGHARDDQAHGRARHSEDRRDPVHRSSRMRDAYR